uniref:Secreted protein n=1 Tax=Steinernema glaseri TaxID=37863 RepID=A0A1I8A5C3_9BILA
MVAVGVLLLLPSLLLATSSCSAHIVEAEGLLKKDVAEAPSAERRVASVVASSAERTPFEGSGAFEWSDDEDLALEGSGSGAAPPVIQDVTPSELPPKIEIVPEIRVREEATATPSMPVIELQATTASGAPSTLPLAVAFCAVLRLLAVF